MIPILERAVEAVPLTPNLYNHLARAHFLVGDPLKAIEVSERVDRAIHPGNMFTLGNLVHFYLVVGRESVIVPAEVRTALSPAGANRRGFQGPGRQERTSTA